VATVGCPDLLTAPQVGPFVASDADIEEVFAREKLWKEKLGTKVKGLNRN